MNRIPFFSKAFLLLFGAIFSLNEAFGQQFTISPLDQFQNSASRTNHEHNEKCGHGAIEQLLVKEMGYFGTRDFFEDWIDQKIEAQRNQPQILAKTQEEKRLIPVVVHVIHNGTPVGEGANIPFSQIENQIRILNEDFNRMNPDADRTPAEFLPVAASANIEFVLAKQDPDGLPTNGVVRIEGPNNSYLPDDATIIGQLTQWNPEEYLNIWVVPLTQPYIGYASFPISDLPGLNFSPTPAIIDGVTIDYRFFGTGGNAISASLGRTATHEVGHYFGLRHIWGDGGCGVDDFVEDTPLQDNSNSICNANPTRFSCDSNDMIQNFMDYTPDACMNLFTLGQVERFDVVLANSPRRTTLINNRATEEPALFDRDLAITRIIEPADFTCDAVVNPKAQIKNAGLEAVSSARVSLSLNGTTIQAKNFTLNLETGETSEISFDSFELVGSENEVEFEIVQVNNSSDENPENNKLISNPIVQVAVSLPLSLDLSNIPNSWTIKNPDDSFTWETTQLSISEQQEDLIYIRNYEYDASGELDYFISPVIDLSENPNAQLVFEMAHAPYNQQGFQDDLIVAISADCGNTFNIPEATYQKSGTSLSTSAATLNEFIPTNADQFRTELVNLQPFADLGRIRIAFINLNAFGNNIYLKNIRVLQEEEFRYSLKMEELIAPLPISDGRYQNERIEVTNTGNLPVSNFVFVKSVNGGSQQAFLASGNPVAPGETFTLTGGNSTRDGKNRLDYGVILPNFDQNGGNESELRRYVIENTERSLVPWRQNFNVSTNIEPWQSINPENDTGSWTSVPVAGSRPGNASAVENPLTNRSYWLGTPIFDLAKNTQASLFFDYAVGTVAEGTKLEILASDDAGDSYEVVWEAIGAELSTVSGIANPNNPQDYERVYVNLTDFAGERKNEVRLAAVLTVGEGENSPIYLDNLELFLSANPNPVIPGDGEVLIYPNPATAYFNIAFNLPQYENVTIQIISSTGSVVHQVNYAQTLNQTYTFPREIFSPGLYLVRMISPSLNEIQRVFIK
ncbi:T9SS type A sorting domain-containing protein [Algoriphagus kandeliae]|uniref:T9SS type A sorting domain-containing protein n=1 Tax=Algoriphagus kandeliae TaxID=2562278 RepID=A0A4Y9QZ28_9BACT|nr:M43 family zinc metalloprotease [Algoriphagus kandeliae]TFV97320.1 T9SS type A sorting domain-containing protein [Algoriphagus kandeliae]